MSCHKCPTPRSPDASEEIQGSASYPGYPCDVAVCFRRAFGLGGAHDLVDSALSRADNRSTAGRRPVLDSTTRRVKRIGPRGGDIGDDQRV